MTGEEVSLRPAQRGEEDVLSDLAFRAKASLGYDAEFMEACRAELTFAAYDLGRLVVGEVGGSPAGVVGLDWRAEGEADGQHHRASDPFHTCLRLAFDPSNRTRVKTLPSRM